MRGLTLALILCTVAPSALLADSLTAASRVARVTLYPWGASVVRVVEVSAPAGVHELIVPDLPLNTDPSSLRVAGQGVTIGAVNLQYDRLPVTETTPDPEIAAAEAEVKRLPRRPPLPPSRRRSPPSAMPQSIRRRSMRRARRSPR